MGGRAKARGGRVCGVREAAVGQDKQIQGGLYCHRRTVGSLWEAIGSQSRLGWAG